MADPLKETDPSRPHYANHILHYHKVVDAFGHISVRHPTNPDFYILSGSVAPALVESPDDLIVYWVKDSSSADPNSKKGYLERFIHGEIYKRFEYVNCVVHSHSESVVPYTIGDAELKPMYHMAGFLGGTVRKFDISELYASSHDPDIPMNMLISTAEYGTALAEEFVRPAGVLTPTSYESVVLMAKHGFTAVGQSIQAGVFRAIYTQKNAEIQTTTMMLNGALAASTMRNHSSGAQSMMVNRREGSLKDLSPLEALDCEVFADGVVGRPWELWVREVKASPLYINRMD